METLSRYDWEIMHWGGIGSWRFSRIYDNGFNVGVGVVAGGTLCGYKLGL